MGQLLADMHIAQVGSTIFYTFLGIVLFALSYALIEKVCPFSVKKEISEDQNVALGIIIGAVIIGISIIISSAIH